MPDLINDLLHKATEDEKSVLKEVLDLIREIRDRHKMKPPESEIGKIVLKIMFTSIKSEAIIYSPKKTHG